MVRDRISMMAFQKWWNEEGSAIKKVDKEDDEEFAYRICFIAWQNGAYKKKEAMRGKNE